jgi:dTDP-glucose pyrophosphorylase
MDVCLIPAAGFGKRVGSPLSKEMLVDPASGAPIVDWSIHLALKNNLQPVIITRKEKINLRIYIEEHWPEAKVFLIEASKEWPHSVGLSESLWGEVNLMLLPDTRFEPQFSAGQLIEDCRQGWDLSFATFQVEDFKTWGVVDMQSRFLRICEKPRDLMSNSEQFAAWGLFAFRKSCGAELFRGLLKSNLSHKWTEFSFKAQFHQLEYFRDITRDVTDLESK